jgi:hypothetical protein
MEEFHKGEGNRGKGFPFLVRAFSLARAVAGCYNNKEKVILEKELTLKYIGFRDIGFQDIFVRYIFIRYIGIQDITVEPKISLACHH